MARWFACQDCLVVMRLARSWGNDHRSALFSASLHTTEIETRLMRCVTADHSCMKSCIFNGASGSWARKRLDLLEVYVERFFCTPITNGKAGSFVFYQELILVPDYDRMVTPCDTFLFVLLHNSAKRFRGVQVRVQLLFGWAIAKCSFLQLSNSFPARGQLSGTCSSKFLPLPVAAKVPLQTRSHISYDRKLHRDPSMDDIRAAQKAHQVSSTGFLAPPCCPLQCNPDRSRLP